MEANGIVLSPDPRLRQECSPIEEITPAIEALADGKGSKLASGGMATKLKAARLATEQGCDMVIANGARPELLYDIVAGRPAGTRFTAGYNL